MERLGYKGHVEFILVHLETVLVFVQDWSTVCAERTIC
jgi:hypothetical protein